MTVKEQELYNVIRGLPDELSIKVLDYIEYLKFSNATNNAPKELIVKDKKPADVLNTKNDGHR